MLDPFLDRITAIGELAFDDRTHRRLGNDHPRRRSFSLWRLRNGDPRGCIWQATSATAPLGHGHAAQSLDIAAAIKGLSPNPSPIALKPSAADVGVESSQFDAQLSRSLGCGQHLGALGGGMSRHFAITPC